MADSEDRVHWQCILCEKDRHHISVLNGKYDIAAWTGTLRQIQEKWRNFPNCSWYTELLWLPWNEYDVLRNQWGPPTVSSSYDEFWKKLIERTTCAEAKLLKQAKTRAPDHAPFWWDANYVSGDDMMAAIRAMSSR